MPQLGGAAISKDLRHYKYALYLGPASSTDNCPVAPLGSTDPASPWVIQGRLKGDAVTWAMTNPSYLEGRTGFENKLNWKVVNKAEDAELTINLDEADPDVLAWLRGETSATSLSSASYTGESFSYKIGKQYLCQALLVGIDVASNRERHVYSGNASVTFKLISDNEGNAGVTATLMMFDISNTETFRVNEWDSY